MDLAVDIVSRHSVQKFAEVPRKQIRGERNAVGNTMADMEEMRSKSGCWP